MPSIDRSDCLTWPLGWTPPMVKTTKAQRKALKAIFDRGPLWRRIDHVTIKTRRSALTYREWRKGFIYPGHDCIMVKWLGMWLGIEEDGYTHS